MMRGAFLAKPAPVPPGALLLISRSPEETLLFGEKLGGLLPRGSIVALRGGLGVGKTCFTKGIARSLGILEEVTSPTYTILSVYESGEGSSLAGLYHFDTYRLSGDGDFAALGADEYLYGDGVSVIEWSEKIPGSIPESAISVEISIIEGEKRQISILSNLPGLSALDFESA
jgi:tRNA threonylcarbamoyladenosine biosynthesis protein TsaE